MLRRFLGTLLFASVLARPAHAEDADVSFTDEPPRHPVFGLRARAWGALVEEGAYGFGPGLVNGELYFGKIFAGGGLHLVSTEAHGRVVAGVRWGSRLDYPVSSLALELETLPYGIDHVAVAFTWLRGNPWGVHWSITGALGPSLIQQLPGYIRGEAWTGVRRPAGDASFEAAFGGVAQYNLDHSEGYAALCLRAGAAYTLGQAPPWDALAKRAME